MNKEKKKGEKNKSEVKDYLLKQKDNIWLHMSCSLFIPELYFKDDKKYTGINRLDQIDKKRFNLICIVCNTKSNIYIYI